ncbi:MAG: hypothetical protein ACOCT0_00085 [Halobacteriota archaeon]
MVSGSYYTEGEDELGATVNLRAADSDSAEEIESAVDGIVSLAGMGMGGEPPEFVEDVLDSVDISRDDSTVVVDYETTVDDAVENLEALQEERLASGPSVDDEFDSGLDEPDDSVDNTTGSDEGSTDEDVPDDFEDDFEDEFEEDEDTEQDD